LDKALAFAKLTPKTMGDVLDVWIEIRRQTKFITVDQQSNDNVV